MTLTIRPLAAADESDWRRLWTAYLEFYESSVPEEVYRTTFARLLESGPHAAERTARTQGRAGGGSGPLHLSPATTGGLRMYATLQDLYTEPAFRGGGVGRALIEAVYAAADKRGVSSVYWLTQDFNETARVLYDRVANLTPFIKYQR